MADCEVCAYADEHGSWVDAIPDLTHCRRCHGSWPRESEIQHCTACCRTFTNIRAADYHRGRGPLANCLDPARVLDRNGRPRLALSERRYRAGTTVEIWTRADTERPDHFRGADRSASGASRRQDHETTPPRQENHP